LKPVLDRKNPAETPNFNVEPPTGDDIRLPDYEVAHLWGPGFGDEARDGIMYAPREVNQKWQNHGIESRLRELRDLASEEGCTIELIVRAKSYPRNIWYGHEMLKEVSYRFRVRYSDGSTEPVARVDISVPPPKSRDEVTMDVISGSASPWSLM
jgi:hypothetical protein